LNNDTGALENSGHQQKLKYPKSVFFIIVNEFCERFSYYGMKTVLTLYLKNILGYDEDFSTIIYHVFVMLCYFTPVLGAILADTYLGKFWTILSLSIVYALGSILLSIAAIPDTIPQEAFSLVGLFVIALGTGGIKPCVSAFGGDQFVRPQQEKQLEQFFSVFYISINAGSLISTFLTPILRGGSCFGQETCFSLAFGVPAVLMVVATIIFVSGKPGYKMKKPEGNIMLQVVKCMGRAIKNKWRSKEKKHDYWLQYASDKYDQQLISDIKRVLNVLVLYLPIPFFWALFDQQGSRWTFQATRMDGFLGESYAIEPDQMQIVNPILILIMVPIFETLIYPCFAKCNLPTPLQRIGTGGILAAVAFIISAIVELQLEPTYAKIPGSGMTQLHVINSLPCTIKAHYMEDMNLPDSYMTDIILEPNSYHDLDVPANKNGALYVLNGTSFTCGGLDLTNQVTPYVNFTDASGKAFIFMITARNNSVAIHQFAHELQLEKSSSGKPYLGYVLNMNNDPGTEFALSLKGPEDIELIVNNTDDKFIQTNAKELKVGTYAMYAPHQVGEAETKIQDFKFLPGGSYAAVMQRSLNGDNKTDLWIMQITSANTVHMLWLIPQYFVMTIAEVMCSVTGLQFSFTQAPASMRSVMQAIWLMTVAFGNLIVIIISEAKFFEKQSYEFFLFAGLMVFVMMIFVALAVRYEYVDPNGEDEKKKALDTDKNTKELEANGTDNKAFDNTPV